ncbi:Ig-like domain-containing protein [Clostridium paraputrificum]|uniref:Ig-like domain-containing protein n=1 Tax=Clostridium paraputrificum TaxID=29363 RepID=UPI00374F8965
MTKHFNKKIMLLFIFVLSLSLLGCNSKDKSITLSTNVEEDMKVTENSILEAMNLGSNVLKEQNFTDAKGYFEKAISYDKTRVQTYLDIKDKYLEANRLDDAYYFIKLAIDNNITLDNVNEILKTIESKFETTIINASTSVGSKYTLPPEVPIKINNQTTKVKVNWNDTNISTDKVGTFQIEGIASEYNRKVKLNLSVTKIKKEQKIGFITDLYEKSGEIFIRFDECQIFFDNPSKNIFTASNEANKDGLDLYKSYGSNGTIFNGYYIRNKTIESTEYKVSKSSSYKLCNWILNPALNNAQTQSIDYNTFKNYVKSKLDSSNSNRALLFWINTEDNIIINLEMQYTP